MILMNNFKFFSTFCFLFLAASFVAQPTFIEKEKELAYHADVMVNAAEARHRVMAMEKFNILFGEALALSDSYKFPFDSLKWISKKSPKDNSFRIFTWEVKVSDSDVKNFGVLQKNDGTIFVLTDDIDNAENLAEEEFSHENWIGALYYNLMEGTTTSGQPYYLLFGVNRWNKYENVKLIDVLFFSKEGKPYFGLPIFKDNTNADEVKIFNRLAFKYAADAQVSLNYNPGMEMIMVDHLIRKMSRIQGQGETLVPDGTYVGYSYKNGYWNKIDKIATEIMDTAPRPKPVLDERKGMNLNGDQIKKSK